MPREVIMPALGMAQDTGKLVAWMKRPGEAVAVGDVLFEVETDKSVAEVEAQDAGYLTDVTAADGDDVPVGQVIARISETAQDSAAPAPASDPVPDPTPDPAAAAPEPASAPETEPAPTPAADTPAPAPAAAALAPGKPAPASAPGGRILASPKARRLAAEQGLDLDRLRAAGHPEPYHVADLEVLRNLPEGRNSPADAPAADRLAEVLPPQALACQIVARLPRQGIADFLDWMERDGGVVLPPSHLWVSFAARTLRDATRAEGGLADGTQMDRTLTIALQPLGGPTTSTAYADPDRCRLSALRQTDAAADLTVRDLTASRLTSLRLAATGTPTLSIAEAGADYLLTLDFTERQLPEDQAIAMMTDLTERLSNPLLSIL